MIYSDKILSQRLERVEARANADFVESRARLDRGSGARWTEVGGAYAMFDGVESPCTQTFGLGLFSPATDEQFDEIETFFKESDAPVFHEISPMADPDLLPLLVSRGYRPIELSSVLYRELGANYECRSNETISVHVISTDEVDVWAKTSAAGWAAEHESLADFLFNFGRISANCAGAFPYLAEFEGEPIATGMMFVHDGVAMMAGASTIPERRNLGAQNALFHARLTLAKEKGCTLAAIAAAPGSQSQKNAQKNGFHIAYTRTKWQLF